MPEFHRQLLDQEVVYLRAFSGEGCAQVDRAEEVCRSGGQESDPQRFQRGSRLLLGVQMLKTFKSRRKHQVDLFIPEQGNPSVTIKGPEGDRADLHFEWFEREKATKIAEMIAAGFSAREITPRDNHPA